MDWDLIFRFIIWHDMGYYATIVEREKELTCYGTTVVKGVRRWKARYWHWGKIISKHQLLMVWDMGDCVPFFPLTIIDIVNYAFMPLFTGRISYNDQGIPVV